MDVEQRAREFHDAYERLAPQFGYETRPDTREFDPDSPNGRLMMAVIAALTPPERWAEQHARDSKELRSLCAARDEARRERDIAKTEAAYMRGVLEKIAGYRLDQFAGPYDMASACVYDAENACPESSEVPDGRG